MKSKEELEALKEEEKNLDNKLKELTEEEIAEVTGGIGTDNNYTYPIIDF